MNVLFIVVILALVITFSSRSTIWGGATWGLIIGVIVGLFIDDIFLGGKTGLTLGGIIGIISEILGKWSEKK